MYQANYTIARNYDYTAFGASRPGNMSTKAIQCDWPVLRGQLLLQWKKLTSYDLDDAGPDRNRLARLIENKYGISSVLAESYLRNFERTMPLGGYA